MKTEKNIFDFYKRTRLATEKITEPLEIEDFVLQPIEDVSPIKWHLAHTSWFFEQFILSKYETNYKKFNKDYFFLFNSYYNSFGDRVLRGGRGDLSRPTVGEILEYRDYVDRAMSKMIRNNDKDIMFLTELGLNHEQQHQELMITEIKYILGNNPTFPKYWNKEYPGNNIPSLEWYDIPEGVFEIGDTENKFFFDNEKPDHKVYLNGGKLASRPVSNGEYIEFINAKCYQDPLLWLSDGWTWKQSNEVISPLYWIRMNDQWYEYSLYGLNELDLDAPLCHISYYEAEAFARWSGYRLPTEAEWEVVARRKLSPTDYRNLQERETWQPAFFGGNDFIGNVWEWTNSAYLPYPGYKQDESALGEYNGKFMINQMVMRGGSTATPESHVRLSYRNFFHPDKRWQFKGIRLAKG